MKAIGIIPARYESSRFPGKLLAMILGKSLLQRTYENAKKVKKLNQIIIATDDERIFTHAQSFGAHVVMTSKDCPTGTDRIQEVIKNDKTLQGVDIVVNVQGDEPCLNPEVIEKIIESLEKNPAAAVATPITKILTLEEAENPSIVKCVKTAKDEALYFSRTLIPGGRPLGYKADVNYFRHIGIYAYRKDFLLTYAALPFTPLQLAEDLEQLKILEWGYRIQVAVVETANIEVNHPEDIQKVEQFLCKQSSFS